MVIQLSIPYQVDNSLVMSPDLLKSVFLHVIDLRDRESRPISNEALIFHIRAAQAEVERYLSIKLKKQVYLESKNYSVDDWINWGYIKTTYPVNCPISIEGYWSDRKIIEFPSDWLSTRRTSGEQFHRSIALIPNSQNKTNQLVAYIGSYPNSMFYGALGRETLPNYWDINYTTGFDKIPDDLLDLIGKLSSINLLPILSDNLRGSLAPGISSNSISLDGLSKSVSSFANAQGGIFGARIKQYIEEVDKKLSILKDYYGGIPFDVF